MNFLNKYWLCRTPMHSLRVEKDTLWRANKQWQESLLAASNPAKYRSHPPPGLDDDDIRVELQNIRDGKLVTLFAISINECFEGFGADGILIPQWSSGVVQFSDPEDVLPGWKYKGQGLVK